AVILPEKAEEHLLPGPPATAAGAPAEAPQLSARAAKRKLKEQEGVRDIPMLVVFNKMDRCHDPSLVKIWGASLMREYSTPQPLYVSAHNPDDVKMTREKIMKHFERDMVVYEVVVPFEDGKTVAQIHELGNVEAKRPTEKGTFFRLRTLPEFANQINLARYKI
ncbi:MAG: hypothetical protein HY075_12940, partial [Deltaproteobacteria bacterium]|nr:hypothetical protein [Deltaproteobacteria bacterium]